ncbi:MAG: PAS domain S-box protein [Planctomycetes bacterium]|nr:PAS domain S-box protein [Planctomycetota bacterium]
MDVPPFHEELINGIQSLDFPGLILIGTDNKHRVLVASSHAIQLIGKRRSEVIGSHWYDVFVDAEWRDLARSECDRFVKHGWGSHEYLETKLTTAGGDVHLISWRPAKLSDREGNFSAIFCIGEDVTELAEARTELADIGQFMRSVVDTAAEGIIAINSRGEIRTVNQAAERLFGWSADELVGRNVSTLMPDPWASEHDSYIQNYERSRVPKIIGIGREVSAKRKDGTLFPAYLSVSEVTGGIYTGIVRDLSAEKVLQQQLQEQEALATLGKMAAVVAHEVRNPLAGIAGVIQVLRSRSSGGTPEHEIMGDVLSRIDSLVETINDLLLYARPRELRPVPVRISELLAESARLVENTPGCEGIRVDVPKSEYAVNVDVEYLREALLNVLLNAAQAMGGKGRILAQVQDCDDHCCVHITDSGPGIPADIRDKVFEPFFTTKGRGTGLGLALVKRVAERHGGEIAIKCPPEGGTVVTVRLPYHRVGES